MNLTKEFFYFTKSKLIIFLSLAIALFYFMVKQGEILGNFTWSGLFTAIILLYLFLNILFFSFKSLKHFLIGLIVFGLIIGANLISSNYYTSQRDEIYNNCLKSAALKDQSDKLGAEKFYSCLSQNGYKLYR